MTREEASKVLLQHSEHWKRLLTENICSKEEGSQTVEALNMAIKALEQEPSRDIKEIAEIMKCDADAETKCKMISNILTAKPHYFAEQEPMREFTEEESKAYSKTLDKMYKTTGFNVFDIVNTPWIYLDNCANSGYYCSKCKKKLVKDGYSETVKKINFCPNCGARLVEPQESEEV